MQRERFAIVAAPKALSVVIFITRQIFGHFGVRFEIGTGIRPALRRDRAKRFERLFKVIEQPFDIDAPLLAQSLDRGILANAIGELAPRTLHRTSRPRQP